MVKLEILSNQIGDVRILSRGVRLRDRWFHNRSSSRRDLTFASPELNIIENRTSILRYKSNRRLQPPFTSCSLEQLSRPQGLITPTILVVAVGTVLLALAVPKPAIAQKSTLPVKTDRVSNANPFQEIDQLAETLDLSSRADLWRLVHESYRRGLHGTSRRFARETLRIAPDFAPAWEYLGYQKGLPGSGVTWMTKDEVNRRRRGLVRHLAFGWVRAQDLEAANRRLLRDETGNLVPAQELDAKHNTWATRRTIETQHFAITSSVPLEVMWYVADDLDKLVIAYADFFEIARLSEHRFTANLYYNSEDAKAAGAREDLLVKYGAYYFKDTLHVMFRSLGGMTAVRHEAAHALNRVYIRNLPQWLDEGIGVMCQFIHVDAESGHTFGRLPPRHRFGLQFLEEVRNGGTASLAEIHRAGYVKTDSHYYSQFRSIVDFCMNGNEKQYRSRFLKAVFDNEGTLDEIFSLPGIDQEWLSFIRQQESDQTWQYLFDPERAESLRPLLMNPRTKSRTGLLPDAK